ncbi:MAG: sporulation protein YqfC [Clostridia bacterium]|nr:sporulation protein YqfC [Clostridia bacterium]
MEKVAHFLKLPPEIIYNLPKVTLIGNLQVLIENHRGIIEYSTGKVRVSVNTGEIEVQGQELVICNITRDGICLEGDISGLKYHR